MSAQSGATSRNSEVEFFIDFVLRNAADIAISEGLISSYTEPVRQVAFQRDDCSDVFDHRFTIRIDQRQTDSPNNLVGEVQIWAQTTCYKGNQTGRAEPNKTYEIRETLIEALTLRKWLELENATFRTLHFTVGPSGYSYGWMKAAKDSAFDLSLYPQSNDASAFFAALHTLIAAHPTETLRRQAMQKELDATRSVLARYAQHYRNHLLDWIRISMPRSPEAVLQGDLLAKQQSSRDSLVAAALKESQGGGADLKPSFLRFLRTGECQDPVMIATASELLEGTPFLTEALSATQDWNNWVTRSLPPPSNITLEEYIASIWNTPLPQRLVWRRILLRIHSAQGVSYVQDTTVDRVTEHNLYGGHHDPSQTSQFAAQISRACRDADISTPTKLAKALAGANALRILKASFAYEAGNGTNLKPSFLYVQRYLSPDFECVSVSQADIASPTPYYSAFTTENVRPFTNLKAVIARGGRNALAILKAKYFNGPEFPRRAKEEGYVGLTLKYKRAEDGYKERYPGIPLIMFVDMERNLSSPPHAIRSLVRSGWDVHFSLQSLKYHLERLARAT
jgi:hypothetical protein